MQLIFHVECTPEEYHKAGRRFTFPRPERCLHPECLMPIPPESHGFYTRNAITIDFAGRILIRRFYCEYCGHTMSYLPSFCLPHYQYTLEMIFLGLLCHFFKLLPLLFVLMQHLYWQRQHLQFYRRRFKANLTRIQIVLRNLIPEIVLPSDENDITKRAQKVLNIVTTGFNSIQAFSSRFFAQCNNSFMAPCKLV